MNLYLCRILVSTQFDASVHLVDVEYDTGAVVRQERVRVLPGDTVESLKARVQACEREAIVKTLAAIASGELVLGCAEPHSP